MDKLIENLKKNSKMKDLNQTIFLNIKEKLPFSTLSYNPYCKPQHILNLLQKDDKIIIASQMYTDRFTLVALLGKSNPEVEKFNIGVNTDNGNKKKCQFPDVKYFEASVLNVSRDQNASRPIQATINQRFNLPESCFMDEQFAVYKDSNFDKRFRFDEFNSLNNSNTVITFER